MQLLIVFYYMIKIMEILGYIIMYGTELLKVIKLVGMLLLIG